MDTINAVEAAQAKDTFDVLSFVQNAAYPKDSVTIFTDVAAVKELVALEQAKFERASENRTIEAHNQESEAKIELLPELPDNAARITELTEKVKASAIVFDLQGLPPGLVKEIMEQRGTEESPITDQEIDHKLIAATIQRVKNAAGAIDSAIWDEDRVAKLHEFIVEGEYIKLIDKVGEVNFNAAVFNNATDAGFLGGSSDVE